MDYRITSKSAKKPGVLEIWLLHGTVLGIRNMKRSNNHNHNSTLVLLFQYSSMHGHSAVNAIQWEMIDSLAHAHPRLAVVTALSITYSKT